jgi:hypothetical protein
MSIEQQKRLTLIKSKESGDMNEHLDRLVYGIIFYNLITILLSVPTWIVFWVSKEQLIQLCLYLIWCYFFGWLLDKDALTIKFFKTVDELKPQKPPMS